MSNPNYPIVSKLWGLGWSLRVKQGGVCLYAPNGTPTDMDNGQRERLTAELVRISPYAVFRYQDYRTGKYNGGKYPTLQLVLNDLANTQADRYGLFNVSLTYERAGKNHQKGDPLPKGRFTPKDDSKFVRLWLACGLELPRGKASDIYRRMGKLKDFLLTGEPHAEVPEKITNIEPLELSNDELKKLVGFSSLAPNKVGAKKGLRSGQEGANLGLRNPSQTRHSKAYSHFLVRLKVYS